MGDASGSNGDRRLHVESDQRTGWFWDAITGRGEPPPAPRLLGFELVSLDDEAGVVEAAFTARREFANVFEGVQGGFLAAMLDTVMSFALLSTLPGGHGVPTLEMSVKYLRPAPLGPLRGRGWVTHAGSRVAFVAGELTGPDGAVLTAATATARIVRTD